MVSTGVPVLLFILLAAAGLIAAAGVGIYLLVRDRRNRPQP